MTRLRSDCLVVDGVVMHSLRSIDPPEDGPRVVMVHGVGVSGRNLRPTGERLAERCDVRIPDLPGFGRSSNPPRIEDTAKLADWLDAWMGAGDLPSAVLVGNSYGCQIIAELAVRHPDRVERAVLQGPTVDPRAPDVLRQTLRWIRNGRRERSTQSDVTFRDWRDSGIVRVVRTGRYSRRHRIDRLLPHVRAPVLVVRGEEDPIVPQAWAEEVVRLLPDGRLSLVPEAAHTLTFNHPDALCDVVLPFVMEAARRPQEVGR